MHACAAPQTGACARRTLRVTMGMPPPRPLSFPLTSSLPAGIAAIPWTRGSSSRRIRRRRTSLIADRPPTLYLIQSSLVSEIIFEELGHARRTCSSRLRLARGSPLITTPCRTPAAHQNVPTRPDPRTRPDSTTSMARPALPSARCRHGAGMLGAARLPRRTLRLRAAAVPHHQPCAPLLAHRSPGLGGGVIHRATPSVVSVSRPDGDARFAAHFSDAMQRDHARQKQRPEPGSEAVLAAKPVWTASQDETSRVTSEAGWFHRTTRCIGCGMWSTRAAVAPAAP